MNPYDKGVTLRRLDQAADAIAWEKWRHTSSILAEIVNAHATKDSQLRTPDQKNPMAIDRERTSRPGVRHDGNARRAVFRALREKERLKAERQQNADAGQHGD